MLITTAGAWALTWAMDQTSPIYERCVKCKVEYRWPHLCRKHGLCGLCHEGVPF